MDRSRYTQKVDTAQIQQDLRAAVTDAEILLQSFEMEVLEKLRQKVQMTVSYAAQESEQRLNKTLAENCAREYRQLQEDLRRENNYVIAEITAKQQRLERMLWIVIIIFSLLLIAIIAILLWLVFKH